MESKLQLFCFTKFVNLELSNLCNYANEHKRCPLNKLQNEHNILPSRVVYDILLTLKKYEFSETIAFHNYNEPLMDPRLFEFIRTARKVCPNSKIYLLSNGYYLNQNLALELVDAGVTSIGITTYASSETERLRKIRVPIYYAVHGPAVLDNRLDIYKTPYVNLKKPCYAPLTQIIITAKGKITLCCFDWESHHIYGDLNKQSFEDAMKSKEIWSTYKQLSKGERVLDLCKRCSSYRGQAQ